MQWRHRSTGFFTQILVISFLFYKDCSVKHSAKLTSFPQTIFKIFEIFWSVSLLKMEEINLHSKTYLFKVSNKNARKWCEICLKLTIKTPKRRHWHLFGVFVVNFEPISHLFYCLHCWLEHISVRWEDCFKDLQKLDCRSLKSFKLQKNS